MPAVVIAAPAISWAPMCWPVHMAPKGSAMTRLRAVIDCTETSEARSRAMAWSTHPADCTTAPASQTGRCRI